MNDIRFRPKVFTATCICQKELNFIKEYGEFPELVECSGCNQIWSLNWCDYAPTAYSINSPLAAEKLRQTQAIIKG